MRLIDADILLKRIEQSKLSNPHTDIAFKRAHEAEHCHFLHMVIDMPTVEPKQGEWISMCGNKQCDCSICGERFDHTYEWIEQWNYCPNCGAKMKKGANNEID